MANSKTTSQATMESRRALLKLGTCGAMTNTTFLSTLLHLKMTSSVMSAPTLPATGGYKALVCLFFSGAIDSYNVLAPHGTTQADTHYGQYVTTRSGAAQKRNPALGFTDPDWVGTNYGYMNPIVDSAWPVVPVGPSACIRAWFISEISIMLDTQRSSPTRVPWSSQSLTMLILL